MSQIPAATVANDRTHYAALTALKDEQWTIKYLYDRLGIIDNKTSALLRFNGVAMGFLGVLVSRILERPSLVAAPRGLLFVAMLILAIFAFAEWKAFQIFWLHFDRIGPERSVHEYKEAFFEITCQREICYRQAFRASALAAAGFFMVIIWMAVPVLVGAVALASH
jgi:hypothetical protein